VIAAALGRGYQGRHRLEAAALGLPASISAPRTPGEAPAPQPVTSAPVTLASGTRLAVVPVAHSADPLVDTLPHPVIMLFPHPVAEPWGPATAEDAESAVFAEVDQAREAQVTAELAAGDPASSAYRGRHTA
jgi:hypothetical protein